MMNETVLMKEKYYSLIRLIKVYREHIDVFPMFLKFLLFFFRNGLHLLLKVNKFIILLFFIFINFTICGQVINRSANRKPDWLSELPQVNLSQYFSGVGTSEILSEAKKIAIISVIHEVSIQQKSIISSTTKFERKQLQHGDKYEIEGTLIDITELKIEPQTLVGLIKEEEYWEESKSSTGKRSYNFWILMKIPKPQRQEYNSNFSKIGAMAKSAIIPGWGQLYKKEKTKGILMFGATGLLITSIILTDNQRTTNLDLSLQTRDINERKALIENAGKWENSRNIVWGIGAGFYLYNLIDAITARGAKIYSFSPTPQTQLEPQFTANSIGLNLKITLNN